MSNKKPLVSIILPTHNRDSTLADSINSVLGQTFGDFELIVVDDGSTDQTSVIVNSFRDTRIRYVPLSENKGAAYSRNMGLAESRGELVAFQDSDDIWLPLKLEKQLAAWKEAGEDAVVYSDMLRIDARGASHYFAAPDVRTGVLVDPATNDYQVFRIGIVTVLGRKRLFESVGGFDESLPRYIDLDILARLVLRYRFHHIKEPLVIYRTSRGISSNPYNSYVARDILLRKFSTYSAHDKRFLSRQHYLMGVDLISCGEIRKSGLYILKAHATSPGTIKYPLVSLAGRFKKLVRMKAGNNDGYHDPEILEA